MLLLTENDSLQVVLGSAVASKQLQCVACYRDFDSTTYDGLPVGTDTDDTTPVDVVSSPSVGVRRAVDFLSVYNSDSDDALVTIKINLNGTAYTLWKDTLSTGDTVRFIEGAGFIVSRTYQSIKSFTVHGDAGANFAMTNATLAERLAGNTSRHIFMVDLAGYTQVRLRANKMVAGTAGSLFRAKYYTTYTTTVGNFIQLGSSAQVELSMAAVGYGDTGWMDLAAGARINGCCIGFTELGGDGVADPALGATDILFR